MILTQTDDAGMTVTAFCDGCACVFGLENLPGLAIMAPKGSSLIALCGTCAPLLSAGVKVMMEEAMAPILETLKAASEA